MSKPRGPEAALLVFLALAVLFVVTGFLTNAYGDERRHRAEAHFRNGEQLARAGRPGAAVEEYRAALTYSHNSPQYELSLALALVDLGQLEEAEAHLVDLHESDPNNALVDLLLARIAARQKHVEEAVTNYHLAIYGLWPADPEKNRLQARFELVDLLGRTGQRRLALAELLALAGEAPEQPAVQNRIGELLLSYGSPDHAADMFRNVLDGDRRNAEAEFGLARAEFAQGRYQAAEAAFRQTVHLDPLNTAARQRLEETERILALDPTLIRLSASQRYRRSRKLVQDSLAALENCFARLGRPAPDNLQGLAVFAQDFLQARKRHREGDTPQALTLAEQLWRAGFDLCGRPPASEEALNLVMAKVAR